jgi:hypothetical protein
VGRTRSEVLARFLAHALAVVAAVVHAFIPAELPQFVVDDVRERPPRALHPLAAVKAAALQGAAALRMLTVRAAEPLVGVPLETVILPLGDHHVDVGVVLVAIAIMAGMDRERVRQVLTVRQRVDELARDLDLVRGVEAARQGEVPTDVEPPVRAFIQIRRIPVGPSVVVRPRRHVA